LKHHRTRMYKLKVELTHFRGQFTAWAGQVSS